MLGWLMIFLGGLLGSSHCVGMCGGFVLTLGTTRRRLGQNLARQLVYSLGRVFSYTVGGAAVGYGGLWLAMWARTGVNVLAVLAVVAGMLLIVQGLISAGVLRRLPLPSSTATCLGPTLFAGLFTLSSTGQVFLAGMANGLLPCGLVYAYLALAASAGDLPSGALTMALFGLGTIPVLVLVGCGGSVLNAVSRHHLVRVAAWCVVMTGVLSVARGFGFMAWAGLAEPSGCPMCR